MGRRALLLVNPVSRSGADAAVAAATILRQGGLEVIEGDGAQPDKYADCVRGHRGKVDCVVVGGGDGSAHLALPGLLGLEMPLGFLPLGTANNLARNLGLPTDLAAACAVVVAGATRRIDVADVNGHYFFNVAGLGLSSEVNRRVPRQLKRHFGVLAYAGYAFKVARRFRPFHAEIEGDDGKVLRVRSMQITVCNGKHYGNGLSIAKIAQIDDGRLDLCSTEVDHWWRGMRNLPALLRGDPDAAPDVRWLTSASFKIRTRRPMRLDADGEMVGKTPALIRVHPRRVEVYVPDGATAPAG